MSTTSRHHETHFQGGAALRDIVIGMSDGLTVPFALAAGLSGASIANSVIVTAGIAELIAGAISMGLGGYLAGRADVEHYGSELMRESSEVEMIPKAEEEEVKAILAKFGISKATQSQFVKELSLDPRRWVDFMMEFELGLQRPDESQVKWGAVRIGASYACGGIIPLSAYFLTGNPHQGLLISSLMTVIALGVFGYVKSNLLNQPRFRGTARMIFVGALAAAVSFAVARFIS